MSAAALATVAAVATLGSVLLLRRPGSSLDALAPAVAPGAVGGRDALGCGSAGRDPWRRRRLPLAVVSGAGVAAVLDGTLGWGAGVVAAVVAWRAVGRLEAPAVRREREEAAAQLPVLVDLLAAALAAGAPCDRAVAAVCDAWPGAAAARLGRARAALGLGVDPVAVWEEVATDAALAPLGRALARAAASGAPIARTVARLADELAETSRAGVEDRARTVGVRAAVPLGLCLLPAFVLLGIVPLAAGLLGGLVR
jgi:Flp pilus assembly protein TadB